MTDAGPEALLELREVMQRLRAECPWKREQTHRSLVRYLVEELHETVDAIESGTPDDLCEELGDLLLQVYFHAAIAEESGAFTVDDVAAGIVAKMVRRNPHVFGEGGGPQVPHSTAAEVNELWESVKATEKQRSSITDGIASTLPALLYADKVLDRLGRAGRTPKHPATIPVLLFVPSPFLGPATWRPVAWWLSGAGHDVEVVDLGAGPRSPASVSDAVVRAADGRPVVLVPHSNAGLFVPHLLTLLDVRATVYVDAALAGTGSETPLAPAGLLSSLSARVADDGLLPVWTRWWDPDTVTGLFPDAATRAGVEAEQVRLPLRYLCEQVPSPSGWTATPSAYLAFGDTYADELERAVAWGWPTATMTGGHLHVVCDPAAVGAAIAQQVEALLGVGADGDSGAIVGERILQAVAQARAVGADPEQELRDAVRRLLARAR